MNLSPNLLIVDDNMANIFLLEAIIRTLKVNLIKATSGNEALQKIKGVGLALAIIDVQMPEMNGYELALKINEQRLDDKVPVIFLTANYFDEADVAKGYDSGAVDYIFKPVNSRILLSKTSIFLDLYNQKQTIIRNAELLKKSADELIRTNDALKKREEKLQEEQLFTNSLLNSIPGIFYLYTYPELKMVTWNKQHETLLGFEATEMKDRHVLEWHTPENREAVLNSLDGFMDTCHASVESWLLAKDGHSIPFLLSAVKFESRGQNYLIGIGTDITERIKAEEELKNSLAQLHQLSQHIEKARENERVAISRELHDDLGQALTAVKIDMGIIKQKISDDNAILRINKVIALVGETIKTVQRLTSQLRPEIIDDLGLVAAVDWYSKEFAERTGIEVLLDLDSDLEINPNNSLPLFRIIQESLTNIARHSKATRAEISLGKNGNSVHCEISDNGIGITDDEIQSKKSFGIMSMKERVASLNGSFEICSKNNCGTVIKFSLSNE